MIIKWLGHASFLVKASGKNFYLDPYAGEYLEEADVILITHSHRDHCDPDNACMHQVVCQPHHPEAQTIKDVQVHACICHLILPAFPAKSVASVIFFLAYFSTANCARVGRKNLK